MKPNILVSSCALGNKVRHNGSAKPNHWLLNNSNEIANLIPVCPEISMGLGTPREAMRIARLEKDSKKQTLITHKTKNDMTEKAQKTSEKLISSLFSSNNIHGILMMGGSPTCGLERVNVYDHNGSPTKTGTGIFSKELIKQYPNIPRLEVGRLSDETQKKHFFKCVEIYYQFKNISLNKKSLQAFQLEYKYLLTAHSQVNLRFLGQIASGNNHNSIEELFADYETLLAETLRTLPTKGTVRNAIQHMYGYLKQDIPDSQKRFLLHMLENSNDDLEQYQHSMLTLLNFENMRQNNEYLNQQTYLTMAKQG